MGWSNLNATAFETGDPARKEGARAPAKYRLALGSSRSYSLKGVKEKKNRGSAFHEGFEALVPT